MKLLFKSTTAMGAALALLAGPAVADMAAATAFLDNEINGLSVLDRAGQEAEMQWFIDAAAPMAGMDIKVVSETITTHEYESQVLAPAFTAITGITVTHDLIGEGDVVEKLQTQMQSGENIYDGYVNDSDLIGTHWRYQQVRNLTDWMAGEGADVTNPGLDLADFIGTQFTTAPDGKLYQLPDQQFANLYWFRADWFDDEQNKADFKAAYGYDLGVPVNWSAYEDIAEFFTGRDLSRLGVEGEVFGNMDYGKKDPSLGWRYTDAWMSMAGMGDVGEPNGLPVDEWGIRVDENSRPVGSCVARGGATNDAAAVYAVTKAIEWLNKYTPPAAAGMTFGEAGPIPAQGNIAQQMFWYTAFTADTVKPGLPVMNEDGTPKWRMAPSPHGVYWKDGQKIGYQDVGSWTLMKSTPVDRAKAAWLYAQFVTSKTVDLKKADVGLTFIREFDDPVRPLLGTRQQAGRSGRVLPLARAHGLVAHRHQRAGLSEAGAAVVAEHRRRDVGCKDAARSTGCPVRSAGKRDGADRACGRSGRYRPEDERAAGSAGLAGRAGVTGRQAGQRGRGAQDHQL